MAPDLNYLPTTSSSPSPATMAATSPLAQRPRRISISTADVPWPSPPSPRSPSLSSLQAAATINAGLQRSPGRQSPRLERRRSSLINNLTINDPTIPAPGELQQSSNLAGSPRRNRRSFAMSSSDPHHHRQPSLGELHQQLESEQEAQVNRLLHLIRLQQEQIATIQRQQQALQEASPTSSDNTGILTPPSSFPTPTSAALADHSPLGAVTTPTTTSTSLHAQNTLGNVVPSLSRQSSARMSTTSTTSRADSPTSRPLSSVLAPLSEDFLLSGTRDECAFYQAETQMLTRENQMLKLRIRELERQVAEMSAPSSSSSPSSAAAAATATAPAAAATLRGSSPTQHSPLAS